VWWDIELLPKKKGQKKTRKQGKRKRGAAAAAAAAAAMDEEECVLLQRCCKLLVHEIGHLLGVGHCIHYACCMQGSGHLLEDFEQPSFLCPVCKAATIVAAPGLHPSKSANNIVVDRPAQDARAVPLRRPLSLRCAGGIL